MVEQRWFHFIDFGGGGGGGGGGCGGGGDSELSLLLVLEKQILRICCNASSILSVVLTVLCTWPALFFFNVSGVISSLNSTSLTIFGFQLCSL